MRAGDLWRKLLKKLEMKTNISPDEFEVYNGTVVFWFYDGAVVRDLLKRMKEKNFPYEIQWDREEGFMGITVKKNIIT